MRNPLAEEIEVAVRAALAESWTLPLRELRYFPEGGGAYHWIALSDDRPRWFVTCDDLDTKPWFGDNRISVFDGLLSSYRTAMDLCGAGLNFVAAPIATTSGAPALRVDDRYTVAVFDFVDGEPGRWGQPVPAASLEGLLTKLTRVHGHPSSAAAVGTRPLAIPDRLALCAALDDLDCPWDSGPFAEQAREVLREHRDNIRRWIEEFDLHTDRLAPSAAGAVITHGEPHPGNVLHSPTGLVLIDWDTVALARPERDLWMISDAQPALVDRYRELTGVALDRDALRAYRSLWALADLAAFTAQLRRDHGSDADAERALGALHGILSGREPAPYGVARRP